MSDTSSELLLESPRKRRRILRSTSSLSTCESSSSLSSISLLSDSFRAFSFNEENYKPKSKEPMPRGIKYQWFKPIANVGVYSQIVKKYDKIDEIVNNLIREIETNNDKILDVLQIIPDLLLIEFQMDSYSSQEYELEIGRLFELRARVQENFQRRKTIFSHSSNYAKDLSNLVDEFLWHFCKTLTANPRTIPLAMRIFQVLTSFLRHLAASDIDELRLVSYVFALRIMKFFSLRKLQIARNESCLGSDKTVRLFAAIEEFIVTYQIDKIYKEEGSNPLFKLFYLEVARTFKVCFIASHEVFVNEKNFKLIAALLASDDKNTVASALDLLSAFTNAEYLHYIFTLSNFKVLLPLLENAFLFAHDDVIVQAAIFYSNAFKNGISVIETPNVLKQLLLLTYNPNLVVGKACGKALACYLERYDNIQSYTELITLAESFERETSGAGSIIKYAYLVESLYNHYDKLKIEPIFSILKKKTSLNMEQYQKLCEIMYHAVYIKLRGKCKFARTRPTVAENKSYGLQNDYEVAHWLLISFQDILNIANRDIQSMRWIFQALILINYQAPHIAQLSGHIKFAVAKCNDLFESEDMEREILWEECMAFVRAASLSIDGQQYIGDVENLFNMYLNEYSENILEFETLNDSENFNDTLNLKLKIVCLLKKIRIILASSIPVYLNLDSIYRDWSETDLPQEIIIEQVNCCVYHFRMLFNKVAAVDSDIEINSILVMADKALMLWKSMDALFLKYENLRDKLYLAMGNFITNYKLLISPQNLEKKPDLKHAKLNYWDVWESANEVFNFFFDSCLRGHQSNILSVAMRRTYMTLFFTMFQTPTKKFDAIITLVCAFNNKEEQLYTRIYKEYFDLVREQSKEDYYFQILHMLDVEKTHHDLEEVQKINFEELAQLYATSMPTEDRLPFVEYILKERKDLQEIKKYVRIFIALLPEKARNRMLKKI